eukprot:comp21997_c0_seq1/m.50471 comp21997_c0_seq1/g.50471  ORF comp21997_c0_seq1/g.50471 comp21997_c0_seq1/m.50471 type:complete len:315 (+) comp21997_c0_seq1:678-1622(+)
MNESVAVVFDDIENPVRVAHVDAVAHVRFARLARRRGAACAHQIVSAVVPLHELLEELAGLDVGFDFLEIDRGGDGSREIADGVRGVSAVQGRIGAVELGIGLFDEHDPELVFVERVGKERARLEAKARAAWNSVVDNHLEPHTKLVKVKSIHALGCLCVLAHHLTEQVRLRCNHRESAKEPAVSDRALLDVSWLDAVCDENRLLEELLGPQPHGARVGLCKVSAQRAVCCWEGWVFPELSWGKFCGFALELGVWCWESELNLALCACCLCCADACAGDCISNFRGVCARRDRQVLCCGHFVELVPALLVSLGL